MGLWHEILKIECLWVMNYSKICKIVKCKKKKNIVKYTSYNITQLTKNLSGWSLTETENYGN